MGADVHPLVDVEFAEGRVKRLRIGRCAVKLVVSLSVIVLLALLAASGRVSVDQLIGMLSALPKF